MFVYDNYYIYVSEARKRVVESLKTDIYFFQLAHCHYYTLNLSDYVGWFVGHT